MVEREIQATKVLLSAVEEVHFGHALAWEAGMLIWSLRRKGITVHLADGIIAASALAMKAPVLTHNVSHFIDIPGLNVIDAGSVAG